ncbi:MAG: hypothetical protein K8F30_07905, partial [Taibaiella sp.]|nr:hypothetical protein [Taibaiella sp.]
MQELTLLHSKLDKLLKKYAALQAEKESLQQALHEQKAELQKLNKKVITLEDQLTTAQTADALASKGDRNAMRKQLNSLI